MAAQISSYLSGSTGGYPSEEIPIGAFLSEYPHVRGDRRSGYLFCDTNLRSVTVR